MATGCAGSTDLGGAAASHARLTINGSSSETGNQARDVEATVEAATMRPVSQSVRLAGWLAGGHAGPFLPVNMIAFYVVSPLTDRNCKASLLKEVIVRKLRRFAFPCPSGRDNPATSLSGRNSCCNTIPFAPMPHVLEQQFREVEQSRFSFRSRKLPGYQSGSFRKAGGSTTCRQIHSGCSTRRIEFGYLLVWESGNLFHTSSSRVYETGAETELE